LNRVSHRVYTEGFIDGFDSSLTQNYESSSYIRDYQFLGTIIANDGKWASVEIRAKFSIGEEIEFIFPDPKKDIQFKVDKILNEENEYIGFTKPNTIVKLELPEVPQSMGILRKRIN